MPGATSDAGRGHHTSLDSYHPPQTGQPPANKVLPKHDLSAPLGAWGLGFISMSKLLICTRQEKKWKKKPGRPWLFPLQVWMFRPCDWDSLMIFSWPTVHARWPLLTRNLQGWIPTLPVLRASAWLTVVPSVSPTTPSFGRDCLRMNQGSMVLALAWRSCLLWSLEPMQGTERMLALHLSISSGYVYLPSLYAPTLCCTSQAKDQFCEALDDAISSIPSTDSLYMLGDFNARVGVDSETWPTCLGHIGISRINKNRHRPLQLCWHHSLCGPITFFQCKELQRISWRNI